MIVMTDNANINMTDKCGTCRLENKLAVNDTASCNLTQWAANNFLK